MSEDWRELSWEEFVQMLVDGGWTKEDAEAKRIKEEEPESEL